MKYLFTIMLTLCGIQTFASDKCVTYNPKTGTYTIDHSGSVSNGKPGKQANRDQTYYPNKILNPCKIDIQKEEMYISSKIPSQDNYFQNIL